jgi:sphingomyelin synthase-related protein 1
VTCADVMYSGHTVNITLCAMTWHTYSHVVPLTKFDPICALRYGRSLTDTDLPHVRNEIGEALRWTSLKIVIWSVASIGYILIIATHFHYTLDVFIGAVLAIVVFKFYLSFVRTAHLRDNKFNRFFVWLEDGADDILEYRRNLPKMYDAHAKFVRSKTFVTTSELDIDDNDDDEEGKKKDYSLGSV